MTESTSVVFECIDGPLITAPVDLLTKCDFFKQFLYNAATSNNNISIDMCSRDAKHFIDYVCYAKLPNCWWNTSSIYVINKSNIDIALNLFVAAEKYFINDLIHACRRYLKQVDYDITYRVYLIQEIDSKPQTTELWELRQALKYSSIPYMHYHTYICDTCNKKIASSNKKKIICCKVHPTNYYGNYFDLSGISDKLLLELTAKPLMVNK